ncbi:MAG: NAD(+)/NADH kinase [Actinobacteria bacterium]|nr:NAD(+)/NADH kinase [Actinomycetota bacterium]
MAVVGLIANPQSGKDIRRLVAHGTVFDNNEKVNVVRRVLLGLDAMGVREVRFMPDTFGIVTKAFDGLAGELHLRVTLLDMRLRGSPEDSLVAASLLREQGVGCLITLGGDGTNRVVAKGSGDVPVLPISTGTNNVFPYWIEGTVAGIAAGAVATGAVDRGEAVRRAKRLEILRNGCLEDIALIDAVVSRDSFVGSKAIWDVSRIEQIVLTRGEPSTIGFSSIGGHLLSVPAEGKSGLYLRIGGGGFRVKAPIAPGLIRDVPVAEHRLLQIGDEVTVLRKPSVIAVDGEREITLRPEDEVRIGLSGQGPQVIDICRTLESAVRKGIFVSE